MPLPQNYEEKVYAGVLGKIIGVYIGRPIETWSFERIANEVGDVDRYLNYLHGGSLIVADDDITGTFTFLRAFEDEGYRRDLTPEQIGKNWLNYTIEERSIFWWGGVGNSTEHTAYSRLKSGIPAPASGSIATNGKVIAEQIGAQIFIDGWGLIAPGDPELAADFAKRAGSVSHDGESVYGAQVIAAMVAQAFVETDIQKLLDTGLSVVPADSDIAHVIRDVREWHATIPDWRESHLKIVENYGYDKFLGVCHMVPNHALIIHALLYGEGDFSKSQLIVNTNAWDTDCNAANVGCILGVRGGLATFDGGYDWRGPVADRLYLSTADGGRGISDAVAETVHVINAGRALAGEAPISPKNGAKFHFSFPGSVQGFENDPDAAPAVISNEVAPGGDRWLVIRAESATAEQPARVLTPTFIPADSLQIRTMPGYELFASPRLYPTQTVSAEIAALSSNATAIGARIVVCYYTGDDQQAILQGPSVTLAPGATETISWQIPDLGGLNIQAVGFEVIGSGALAIDRIDWSGMPKQTFARPSGATGMIWRRGWIDGVDHFDAWWPESFRITEDYERGIISTGTRDWTDYRAEATIVPSLAEQFGLAARVQGLRRYYALLLGNDGVARLVRMDDTETVLAEIAQPWNVFEPITLAIEIRGSEIAGSVNGAEILRASDPGSRLTGGGVGLVIEKGTLSCEAVVVG
jgi:ADP-ribosylglycohydrolase